jgi:type IV fimbrial biogenesis protein FimT
MELLFTIAVAAIILSVGVPGFQSYIDNNRAVTHTNDLVTALNVARSEATRRGLPITVCSSSDGVACGGAWSDGWVVRTGAGEVLRSWPKRSGGAGVVTELNGISEIRFLARGSVAGAAPTFQIRLARCTGNQVRNVGVNGAGRVSVGRVDCP